MTGYPRLSGTADAALSADARRAMAGYAGQHDRLNTRSYLGADIKRAGRMTDEPRPGPLSRLLCHFGMHRWVTMTTGRAGFVHFQRCDRGCGTPRIVKGGPQ